MSIRFSEANAARTESARSSEAANSQRAIDVTIFATWLDAVAAEREQEARFIRRRFRDEFKPAFAAWLEARPRTNPRAPPSPFATPEYRLAEERQSRELAALADRRGQQARDANQQGDDYVLLTVIFASVLFLAGISTKFGGRRLRTAGLGLGTALLLTGLVVELTFPIEL